MPDVALASADASFVAAGRLQAGGADCAARSLSAPSFMQLTAQTYMHVVAQFISWARRLDCPVSSICQSTLMTLQMAL